MSQTLAVVGNQNKTGLSSEDLNILKSSKFKGFTEAEIQFCAKVIQSLNLNPFLNQIHFTKRHNKKDGTFALVTQVGIDGFRLTAQRSGGYAGSDEAIFEYDPKDTGKREPLKATVTVYKIIQGVRVSFTASARWDEYYPGVGPNAFMWDKMPHGQLAKCAEALALRKAFPAELSSVYAEEEMHQAVMSPITPGQPTEENGNPDRFVGKMLRGSHPGRYPREVDPAKLKRQIEVIDKRLQETGKTENDLDEEWKYTYDLICKYLGDLENGLLDFSEAEDEVGIK